MLKSSLNSLQESRTFRGSPYTVHSRLLGRELHACHLNTLNFAKFHKAIETCTVTVLGTKEVGEQSVASAVSFDAPSPENRFEDAQI
jgi:hypothetical protein